MSTTTRTQQSATGSKPVGQTDKRAPDENEDDDEYLHKYAGAGTEDLQGGIPFLSICQKITEDGIEAGKKLGEWWHSGLQISLGKTVNVVFLGWKDVWVEKSRKDGRTVKYYKPNSIELLEKGTGENYTCTNPETGNKVDRSFLVPCILAEV